MKYRDILTIMDKIMLESKKAEKYRNDNYCGYMGEWMNDASEERYQEIKQEYQNFLNMEIKI